MFSGKKSAQIREILISESAWEEMTCLFAPSLEVYVIIDNGYNEFMMIDKLAVYGNRCGYESQNEIIVPPSSVSTFMVPNIALLGLCYTDDIKMVFVSKRFNGLSSENKKMAVPVEVVMRFKLTSTKKYEEYVNVIYSQWD